MAAGTDRVARNPVDLVPLVAARGEDERTAARRALVLGLINVLAASLAAAGQWASWRTENELGLDLAGTDWWRVTAVFAANLAPSALAVLGLYRVKVWRRDRRRRVVAVGVAAARSAVVRLLLLATLRYSPPDLWFVVVELLFGALAVVIAVSLALYDYDVGAELRAAEERRLAEEARAAEAARRAEQADLEVRQDVSHRPTGGSAGPTRRTTPRPTPPAASRRTSPSTTRPSSHRPCSRPSRPGRRRSSSRRSPGWARADYPSPGAGRSSTPRGRGASSP